MAKGLGLSVVIWNQVYAARSLGLSVGIRIVGQACSFSENVKFSGDWAKKAWPAVVAIMCELLKKSTWSPETSLILTSTSGTKTGAHPVETMAASFMILVLGHEKACPTRALMVNDCAADGEL